MNCQSTRDIFPELLDNRSAATLLRQNSSATDGAKGDAGFGGQAAHAEARAHLAGCPDCQREFAALNQTAAALDAMPMPPPSSRLRKNFYAMLEEEKHSAVSAVTHGRPAPRVSLWRFLVAPLAGCALLALGFFAGRQGASVQVADATATRAELKKLQEQVNKMGTLVGYSLLQQQQGSVNDRLRGVLASAQAEKPSDKVLDDLIGALAFDPNANIRLRALEALTPHAGRELVRAGVLAALPREQNPLVQLELIDFVASAQDRNAAPVLEKLAADESANLTVRDAAKLALAQF